jgi:hypothetical protein
MRWELFSEEYNTEFGLLTLLLFMKFCTVIDGLRLLRLLLDQHCKCIKIKYYLTFIIERLCKLLMRFFYSRKFKFTLLCCWDKQPRKTFFSDHKIQNTPFSELLSHSHKFIIINGFKINVLKAKQYIRWTRSYPAAAIISQNYKFHIKIAYKFTTKENKIKSSRGRRKIILCD